MIRRLLAACFVLDGLCAAAALLLAPAVLTAPPAEYVDVAGLCVEVVDADPELTVGEVVPASYCTDE